MREYEKTDPVFYFAYGSNMNPERMAERAEHLTRSVRYMLRW